MKYRIFIIEGCDRTGKSTFIKYLEKKLKLEGFKPFTFHLMGPTKFKEFNFTNDEKSLIQLAKFNDEYDFIREILNEDEHNVVILDRSSFGEYIWTRFWNRTGKYTDYVTSNEFIERHRDLMDKILYIENYMSNINDLKNRIEASEEDAKIFSTTDKNITENINYVYSLYDELHRIIEDNHISYEKIDSSDFKSFKDVSNFVFSWIDRIKLIN